jgi:MFS family permease
MLAYTTFMVGFIFRPLGGLIFGYYGDRIGRKTILVLTLVAVALFSYLPEARTSSHGAGACRFCWATFAYHHRDAGIREDEER